MKTLLEAIEEYKKSPSFSLAADRVEEVHQKLAFEKGYYAGLEAANASERFRAEDAVAALAEENRLREQLSALQQENEKLKIVAEVAARCVIDLSTNLNDANKEFMSGELNNGAYQYVLARHGQLISALYDAGYTEMHPIFKFPVKPSSPICTSNQR